MFVDADVSSVTAGYARTWAPVQTNLARDAEDANLRPARSEERFLRVRLREWRDCKRGNSQL